LQYNVIARLPQESLQDFFAEIVGMSKGRSDDMYHTGAVCVDVIDVEVANLPSLPRAASARRG
jgi:hypothetical protein